MIKNLGNIGKRKTQKTKKKGNTKEKFKRQKKRELSYSYNLQSYKESSKKYKEGNPIWNK